MHIEAALSALCVSLLLPLVAAAKVAVATTTGSLAARRPAPRRPAAGWPARWTVSRRRSAKRCRLVGLGAELVSRWPALLVVPLVVALASMRLAALLGAGVAGVTARGTGFARLAGP